MEHAVILDQERAFAEALSKYLQGRFPTLAWSAISGIKELYRFMDNKREKPSAIIYNARQFPDWTPTWNCQAVILRDYPLYEDIFHIKLAELGVTQAFSENKHAEVYRFDTKAIEQKLRELLGRPKPEMLSTAMLAEKVYAVVSDVTAPCLGGYLDEVFANNFKNGLRTFVLPFTSVVEQSSLTLQIPSSSDHSDVVSLLQRLSKEVLKLEQIFPYVFPTAIPGVMSFVPASTPRSPDEFSMLAVRQLIALLKTIVKRKENRDCALVLCSKKTGSLLRHVLPLCDELLILNNSLVLKNPAVYRFSEEIKAMLPPGFPIRERCLNDQPAPRYKNSPPMKTMILRGGSSEFDG